MFEPIIIDVCEADSDEKLEDLVKFCIWKRDEEGYTLVDPTLKPNTLNVYEWKPTGSPDWEGYEPPLVYARPPMQYGVILMFKQK